jgi:hypothetical protein
MVHGRENGEVGFIVYETACVGGDVFMFTGVMTAIDYSHTLLPRPFIGAILRMTVLSVGLRPMLCQETIEMTSQWDICCPDTISQVGFGN